MSQKPKKSRSKKMPPTEPNQPQPATSTPPTATPAAFTPPQIGTIIMALPPMVNAQWQQAMVVLNPDNPNDPIIQFSDNTQYFASQVQTSAPVAPPPIAGANIVGASLESLRPQYAEFRRQLVELYASAAVLFQMPLSMVITMAYRQAYQAQLEASGKMDVLGNESMFVPDVASFERWVTSYLEEVQRRETKANGPEA